MIGIDRSRDIQRERILRVRHAVAVAVVVGHVAVELNGAVVDHENDHRRIGAHDTQRLTGE